MSLPSDFDIFLPSSSTTKPCVITSRYGARPRVPSPTSSELWNQPRYWSLPSRYMSAGHAAPAARAARPRGSRPSRTRRRGCSARARTRAAARRAREPLGQELLDGPLVPRVGAVLSNTPAARSTSAVVSTARRTRAGHGRDRHAPRALPRDAPVGPVRDHVVNPLLAPRRQPLHPADRLERTGPQVGAVHRDEPLRCREEDHRVVAPPAVRVLVVVVSRCHSRPRSASAASTFGFASNTCSPANSPTSSRKCRPGSTGA
jgi:hypothetical protein